MTDLSIHSLYRGPITWLTTRTILLIRAGSHAYGLNTPTSDIDVRGICVPPREYFLGFANRFEQAVQNEPDLTVFGLQKFFQLAAECNPNIIELLWVEDGDVLERCEPYGTLLLENRQLFLSQRAKHTFSGYAIAQLKRIRTHRKWLLNPPTHQPTRQEYELPETTVIPADILGAIDSVQASGCEVTFPPHVMEVYARERRYQNALREWQQYENWRKTRNPARAALEAKHGYDCKHAMHLVRLMRMCREILTEGRVIVKRPDRSELLEIRNGAWDYDRLVEWADSQDAELSALLPSCTVIPHAPPRARLDALCVQIAEGLRE